MEIAKKFNEMTLKQIISYIDNRAQYSNFNTLGLYRSIVENEKLTLAEKLELREYAHAIFQKTFDFLQLKDPVTYIDVSSLGEELTKADKKQLWENVKVNQQKILADKRIKHRNFGIYSIHDCGYDTCHLNGLMVQQGSFFCENNMRFDTDKNSTVGKVKSERRKQDRKNEKQIIDEEMDDFE